MSATQSIFSIQRYLPTTGIPAEPLKSLDKIVQPIIKSLPNHTCLPSANYYHSVADIALFLRNFSTGLGLSVNPSLNVVGGNPIIGFTSILYSVIGFAWAYDSYKQMKACEKIGDAEGVKLARAQIAESVFFSMASTALGVVRVFGVIQEISPLLKSPIVLSSAAVAVQTAAAWLSTTFYLVFYAIYSWRQVNVLKGLSDGNALRDELKNHADPLELLQEKIDASMYALAASSPEKLTELALEEGAKWLEKHSDAPSGNRQEQVRQLFLDHHEYMTGEMGETQGFNELSPEGKIIRFGRFIAAKRLSARVQNELTRLIGPDAVKAAEKNDPVAFEKALKSADWSQWGIRWKTVFRICVAIVGVSAILAGTILTGGLALGIPLLILGAVGIVWIALDDGALFKSQWESGEIRKRDKFLIYFSLALNVAALAGLITLAVVSGGLPLYIAGIVFTTAWLVINGRAVIGMINSRKAAEAWKKHSEALKAASLLKLKEDLKAASEKLIDRNLIAI